MGILGIVVLVGGGVGCSGTEEPAREPSRGIDSPSPSSLIAEVDSVKAPDRIATTDTLTVRLLGTVGPNGCYSFARMAVERSTRQVRLVPLVNRTARGDAMCTMAIVPLDEIVRLEPPFEPGTLTITVPQPDRTDRTVSLEVVASNE